MDMRPCLSCHRAAIAVLMVLGLAGCGFGLHDLQHRPGRHRCRTVHRPRHFRTVAVKNDESRDVVIRIRADDYDVGRCRSVVIQNLNTRTEGPVDEESAETWICFVPVGDYIIAESMGLVMATVRAVALPGRRAIGLLLQSPLGRAQVLVQGSIPRSPRVRHRLPPSGEFPEPDLIVTSSPEALLKYLEARLPQVNASATSRQRTVPLVLPGPSDAPRQPESQRVGTRGPAARIASGSPPEPAPRILTVHPEGPLLLPTCQLGKVARHSGGCGPTPGNEGANHGRRTQGLEQIHARLRRRLVGDLPRRGTRPAPAPRSGDRLNVVHAGCPARGVGEGPFANKFGFDTICEQVQRVNTLSFAQTCTGSRSRCRRRRGPTYRQVRQRASSLDRSV